MKSTTLAAAAISVLIAVIAPPATAGAAGCGEAESPTTVAPTTEFFDSGRPWLGPKNLPTEGALARLLGKKYERFGPMSEADWVRTFRDEKTDGWRWPPGVSGFDLKMGPPWGAPNEKNHNLPVGMELDRFGFDTGTFLAAAGTPFDMRALPPESLNTPGKTWGGDPVATPEANYHVYCVAKSFQVDAGPIFGWFGQPGLATQFFVRPDYLPHQDTDRVNVAWLLQNHYLVEKAPK